MAPVWLDKVFHHDGCDYYRDSMAIIFILNYIFGLSVTR